MLTEGHQPWSMVIRSLLPAGCRSGEVGDAPDFEDVVAGAGGVGEVADAVGGAAGLDGGFGGGVPDQHDVADLVGPEVGVPEDQVAGPFLAGADPGAVAGGEPAALRS